MFKILQKKTFPIILFACSFSFNSARGADFEYSLFSSVEYSDNLGQVSNVGNTLFEPESGRTVTGGLEFSFLTEQNLTLAADISGRFAKNKYSIDDFSDDDDKSLDVNVLFQPSNNNFRLSVNNTLQQVSLDRESTRTINNVRDINTLNVIPSYFVNLSPLTQLTTEYRYSRIDDISDEGGIEGDSQDVNAFTLGLNRQISSLTSWSINTQRLATDYVDLDQEYDQEEVYLGFYIDTALTILDIEVGRQRIVEVNGVDEDSYQSSIRFALTREINSDSNLVVSYRQGYGDLLNIDLGNSLVGVSSNGQGAFFEGVIEENIADLGYQFDNQKINYSINLSSRTLISDEDLLTSSPGIDEERYSADLVLGYRFVPVNSISDYSLQFGYRHEKNYFNADDSESKVGIATARLTYNRSAKLSFYIEIADRDASGTAQQNNFDEKSTVLGVTFAPFNR